MAKIISRRKFGESVMPSRAKTLAWTLLFCAALGMVGFSRSQGALAANAPGKHDNTDHLRSYRKAIPLVDWTPAELVKRMPELRDFTPADSQETLPQILEEVGANVQSFVRNFMSTASVEEVHQLRMGFNGGESFTPLRTHYLLLGVKGNGGVQLQEYRTNSKGNPTILGAGAGRGLLTHGFASVSVYFDPVHQALSTFRYLGQKAVDDHKFLLVAFAQRVDSRGILARFDIEGYSIPVLVQGVAWIDPHIFQIERLRTDLLAPQSAYDLDQLTTDVTYNEVHFKGAPRSMWLPHDVSVTVKYQNETYHNEHRYSDFRLFNVQAESKKPDRPASEAR